jgi:hypothetical protein
VSRGSRSGTTATATIRTISLIGIDRIAALLCGLRGHKVVSRASFFQVHEARKARAQGAPVHAIAHEDLLVFRGPDADGVAEWMLLWMSSCAFVIVCCDDPVELAGDVAFGSKNDQGEIGVLVAPSNPRDIAAWKYVPLGPVGWTMTLALQDVDADDGDDILLADRRPTQPDRGDLRGLRWLENPGSLEKPWRNHFIGRRGVEVMFSGSGDFDGDGDTDYVVPNIVKGDGGARDSGELYWIENVWDHKGAPSEEDGDFVAHRMPWPDNVGRAKSAAMGDVDLDGRKDVVLTFEEADGGRHGLVWLRQQGPRRQPVWTVRTLSGPDGIKHDDATLVDIDGDGDLDVFTTEERLPRAGLPTGLGVIWYENPTRRPPHRAR